MRKESGMPGKILTVIYLGINAVHDIRKKEILLYTVGVYAVVWILILWSLGEGRNHFILAGISLLLLGSFSVISGGTFGFGDALMISSLGLSMSWREFLLVLCTGGFWAAGYSVFLIFFKKAGRKTEIPFIPFLFLGYIGGLCIW